MISKKELQVWFWFLINDNMTWWQEITFSFVAICFFMIYVVEAAGLSAMGEYQHYTVAPWIAVFLCQIVIVPIGLLFFLPCIDAFQKTGAKKQ